MWGANRTDHKPATVNKVIQVPIQPHWGLPYLVASPIDNVGPLSVGLCVCVKEELTDRNKSDERGLISL